MSKEAYTSVKKRPAFMSKEAYTSVKRGLSYLALVQKLEVHARRGRAAIKHIELAHAHPKCVFRRCLRVPIHFRSTLLFSFPSSLAAS